MNFVVKEYEFDKTDIHEIDYLLDDVIKHCRKNYFHTFEYRLVYDINFTNIPVDQFYFFKLQDIDSSSI